MGQIAVCGPADPSADEYETARTAGWLIAASHETVVCGGLGGVMEAACRGAREEGGLTVGILPDQSDGNRYLDVVVRSGLGHARNVLVVQSADAVIAIGGGYGTLSEIAVALKIGRPVFGIGAWDIGGLIPCASAEEAVLMAVRAARLSPLYRSPRAAP